MKKTLSIFIFFILLCPSLLYATPKLMVVLVVDQLRVDYLDRYQAQWSGGFELLRQNGAVFTNARFTQVPTDTATGHAVLATGTYPIEHGIVGNWWWSQKRGKKVYCVGREGKMGPRNLAVPTLGDYLKETHTHSHVVSLSMKDRAAILMGGHKADHAVWFDTKRKKFLTKGDAPDWLEPFNQGLQEKLILKKTMKQFLESSAADEVLFQLGLNVIDEFSLGKDKDPDLLMISLSATDILGHRVGPNSPLMKNHLIKLDEQLGRFMDELNFRVGAGQYVLALTADHGVVSIPESREGKQRGAQRIMKSKFKKDVEAVFQKIRPSNTKWISNISGPHIYVNRKLGRRKGVNWDYFLMVAAKRIRELDGVAQVYIPNRFLDDEFFERYRLSHYEGRGGDMMVRFDENILLHPYAKGTNHGSPYEYDAHVPVVFYGSNIKSGIYQRPMDMVDFAPTCAKLLGVEFYTLEGGKPVKGFTTH